MPKFLFTLHTTIGSLISQDSPKELDDLNAASKHAQAITETPYVELYEDELKGVVVPKENIFAVSFVEEEKLKELQELEQVSQRQQLLKLTN